MTIKGAAAAPTLRQLSANKLVRRPLHQRSAASAPTAGPFGVSGEHHRVQRNRFDELADAPLEQLVRYVRTLRTGPRLNRTVSRGRASCTTISLTSQRAQLRMTTMMIADRSGQAAMVGNERERAGNERVAKR